MQFLLLLSLIILFAGLSYLVIKWPQGKHVTFSFHAAAYKHTIIYYISLFTITLPMLLWFFLGWFVPTFNLSLWFVFCIILSCLTQYLVTLIPEVGGWKTKVHRSIAAVSALLLLPPLVILALSEIISEAGKGVALFSLFIMLSIIMEILKANAKHRYLLLLQAGYYAVFFLAILFITYFG